jgi:cation transport ATPase
MNQAVVRAVTVMVISCPCALGVAIPMARLAGISLAARRGILVREIESFERADAIDSVVFDKTGTLTHGRWRLNHIECQPGYHPATITAWAAGLEQSSDHEIARAINAYAQTQAITPAAATDVIVHPDGVAGRLDDKTVRIGSRGFAWGKGLPAGDAPKESEATLTSRVFLGIDNRPVATLRFGDTIRPTVPSMLNDLRRTSGKFIWSPGTGTPPHGRWPGASG